MSIVNCVNNWYFGYVFDHNKFGRQSFINLWFVDKEVFHYESQKGEDWVPFNVACDDKTKIVMNSNVQNQAILLLFINSKVYGLIFWGIIFKYGLYFYASFFAVRLSRLVLTLCNLEQYEVDRILCDIVKTLHVIVGFC